MKHVTDNFLFSRIIVAGNILFIGWILFNGMDSSWQATRLQLVIYITLLALLVGNSVWIYLNSKHSRH